MEELILETYRDLKVRLRHIEATGATRLSAFRQCLDHIIFEISRLKKKIDPSTLIDAGSQVRFYKELFPAYFSMLIYYRKLISLETAMEAMVGPELDDFTRIQQEEIVRYLMRHGSLLTYVTSGKRHLDELLFTQAGVTFAVYPDTDEYSGAAFFNFHSFTVSKLMAFIKVSRYLDQRPAGSDGLQAAVAPLEGISTIKSRDFKKEKTDIDKKLSWLEQRMDAQSRKMYLPHLRQRLDRRKASAHAAEALLQRLSKEQRG